MPENDNKNTSEIDEWVEAWSEVSDFSSFIPAEIEQELIEYMKWRIYGRTLHPPAQPLNKGEDDASER